MDPGMFDDIEKGCALIGCAIAVLAFLLGAGIAWAICWHFIR